MYVKRTKMLKSATISKQQTKLQYRKFLLICFENIFMFIFYVFYSYFSIHHNNEQVIEVCFHSIDFILFRDGSFISPKNSYFAFIMSLVGFPKKKKKETKENQENYRLYTKYLMMMRITCTFYILLLLFW